MKNYLNELSDRFEEEIDMYGITAIKVDEEEDDVAIVHLLPIPDATFNHIYLTALETHYESKTFEDLETKGCDQFHAERDNEL